MPAEGSGIASLPPRLASGFDSGGRWSSIRRVRSKLRAPTAAWGGRTVNSSRIASAGAAALLSCALAASAQAQDAKPQYGGELIYAQAGEQFSLFPGRNLDSGAQDVWLYACENLVEMNEDSAIVPWLAKSWTVSPDKKVFTFQLQEGVKFHDGTPFNAEAVAFVFNEAKAKTFIYATILEGFESAKAASEYSVTFHFTSPFAALLPNLAYQKGKPYLDSVKIITVTDPAVRASLLEKGEIDRTVNLNDFDIPRLEANRSIRVRVVPSTRQYYVVLNHMVHPLDHVNVRKAFNYAIDKAGIVKSVFAGRGAVLSKAPTVSEGVYGFTDMRNPGEDTIFPYNLARAKELMKNAGYEDRNKDGFVEDIRGNKLSLNLFTRRGGTKGDFQVAQLMQNFLKDIGVEVKITVLESAAFGDAIKLGPTEAKYDLALLSWGIPTADPDEPMMLFTLTRAWKPVGANRMFYSSDEIDRLSMLAHSETDEAKRKEYVKQWMAELLRDAPVIYLPTLALNLGSRNYLHDDRILSVDNYPAPFAWLDKEEMKKQGIRR
ncbi:MAG: ABC transporter substrate-binding protein [Proteobacteria bacterium]|nr:ABC transporter substrate-binding protein [Pseudomonadota bacterium]